MPAVFHLRPDNTEIPGDRRMNRRYTISLPVRIKTTKIASDLAIGRILNMSSGGIAFTSDVAFSVGASIELAIIWPIPLHDNVPVQLVVRGSVIRTDEQITAVDIVNYQFRTRRRQS
jgi:hypothetical protein